jgi:hypothetical protein
LETPFCGFKHLAPKWRPVPFFYTAHGEGIDGIVAGDGQNADAVSHDNVLALASNAKTGFLEGADGIQMVDAGKLSHG